MTPAERALLIAIAELLQRQTGDYDLQIAIERLRHEEEPPDRRGLSGATIIGGVVPTAKRDAPGLIGKAVDRSRLGGLYWGCFWSQN